MLASGARVGKYEVLEPLGAGAMGQVFRARDFELGRCVALKTLPERLSRDTARLARFEHEARVLASLNHANIATLYEIAGHGETRVLVLELVEGETLAERIARGPLPIAEAVAIAAQLAAALEVAHERGVVHRDLKPANVKLCADGTVKLLDFGLAKVLATHAPGAGEAEATVTGTATGAATGAAAGAVLGTPAYMSPEQARGLPVDKRTDVWAFGCLLYEMLTGRRAFAGEHTTDVVVKVVARDPDFEMLPAECPPSLRRLVRRSLRKDPRQRLRDIGDARLELVDTEADLSDTDADLSRFKRRTWTRAAAASLAVAAAALWLAVRDDAGTAESPSRITRFTMPEAAVNPTGAGATIAVSRDGKRIAYLTGNGLAVRSLDRLDATLVDEPGAAAPFFSPDGQWLVFTDWHVVSKVPVAGGPPEKVADVGPGAMGDWSGDDIFVADMSGFLRIPGTGGTAQRIDTDLAPREQPLQPQYLEGREALLYTVTPPSQTPGQAANAPSARVEALDLRTGERHVVVRGGGRTRYLPTGHLVYVAGSKLYAVPFDVDSLTARGEPVPMLTVDGRLEFGVSDDGTLVYQAWPAAAHRDLVWVDRQGREEPIPSPPMRYIYARLSPDGQRIGLDLLDDDDNRDIWIFDLRRSALERLTRDPAGNPIVAWSPDGRFVAFGSDRFGATNLFRQAADGSGEPERLVASTDTEMPISYAPDGRLLFSHAVQGRQRDIYLLSLDGVPQATPLVATAANELTAEVSPDGRWLAYDSDESGRFEVYVRAFPETAAGGRWQVSSGGGRQPLWSHDGGELLYRDFDGALMSVEVSLTPTFVPGPRMKLLEGGIYVGGGMRGGGRTYDISPDDSRFIMLKDRRTETADGPRLVVVLDWFAELERLAPIDGSLRAARR